MRRWRFHGLRFQYISGRRLKRAAVGAPFFHVCLECWGRLGHRGEPEYSTGGRD